MRYRKVIPVEDAVALVQDCDTVASSGYGGNGTPEALFEALAQRFLSTQGPRDLTLVWAGGQGDAKERGLNHLGHEGLALYEQRIHAAQAWQGTRQPSGLLARLRDEDRSRTGFEFHMKAQALRLTRLRSIYDGI